MKHSADSESVDTSPTLSGLAGHFAGSFCARKPRLRPAQSALCLRMALRRHRQRSLVHRPLPVSLSNLSGDMVGHHGRYGSPWTGTMRHDKIHHKLEEGTLTRVHERPTPAMFL